MGKHEGHLIRFLVPLMIGFYGGMKYEQNGWGIKSQLERYVPQLSSASGEKANVGRNAQFFDPYRQRVEDLLNNYALLPQDKSSLKTIKGWFRKYGSYNNFPERYKKQANYALGVIEKRAVLKSELSKRSPY